MTRQVTGSGARDSPARVSRAEPTDAQVLAGPREGFGLLFERYSGILYGYCARRVGADLAEDLVAETFLTAFERRDGFDQAAPTAQPWLVGIVTNLLRNHLRTEKRAWKALARTGADPLDGAARVTDGLADRVGERVDAAVSTRALAGALAAMPRGHRDVLLLHVWSGLTYTELAEALDLPIGTVRSRLSRARARLRSALPTDASTFTNGDTR